MFRRTINRDIEAICRAGIPLVAIQGYGGGVSIAEEFRLDRSLLTEDELQVIFSGVRGLDSVWDTPYSGALSEKLSADTLGVILIDLASHYQASLTKKIAVIREAIQERRYISFDTIPKKARTAVPSSRISYGVPQYRVPAGQDQ